MHRQVGGQVSWLALWQACEQMGWQAGVLLAVGR